MMTDLKLHIVPEERSVDILGKIMIVLLHSHNSKIMDFFQIFIF